MRWNGCSARCCEPFEAERQVHASFRADQRVDLIDDQRADRAKQIACARAGQQDVKRLWRRDENMGGLAQHRLPFAGGRIPRPHRHLDIRQLLPHRLGRAANAPQRHAQVALDVVVERLQRRNIDQVDPLERRRRRRSRRIRLLPPSSPLGPLLRGWRRRRQRPKQLVDPPQKRRQRLTRPRGRHNQRILAALDRRPPCCLRRRGHAHRLLKPGTDRRQERVKWVGGRCRHAGLQYEHLCVWSVLYRRFSCNACYNEEQGGI